MGEEFWRLADEIRVKYRAVAHSGVRGGSRNVQDNAARAETYREVLGLMLALLLHRAPTREEMATWLAGEVPAGYRSSPASPTTATPADRDAADGVFAATLG